MIGVLTGIFLTIFFFKIKDKKIKRKEKPFESKILKAKTDRELYELLLPYADNQKIKEILNKLEENIYKNSKNKIDKNEILDILEEEKMKF